MEAFLSLLARANIAKLGGKWMKMHLSEPQKCAYEPKKMKTCRDYIKRACNSG